MAIKQSKKSTPKTAKATGSKSKTAHAKSADADGTKSKAKTPKGTSAHAALGKTKARENLTIKTGAAQRKPAEGAASASHAKASTTKGKKTQTASSHAKPAHRKAAAAHQPNGRQKSSNGRAGGMAVRPTGTKSRVQNRETRGGRDLERTRAEATAQTDRISSALFHALESHVAARNLGHVARDGQFDWGEVDNPNLRPDLAFISFDRWAAYRNVPTALTWHVVPDLVIEFITHDEKTEEFGNRLDDYFKAGVNRVWVVYPDLRIFDYQSPSEYQILSRDQSLDGGTLLPGFQIPIKELAEEN